MVGCDLPAADPADASNLVGSVALNLLGLAVACWLLFLRRRGSSSARKPPPAASDDVEVAREAGEAVTFTKGADGSFTLANGQIRAVWAIPASGQSTWAVTYGARPPSGGGGESAANGWVDVARKLGVQIEVRTVEPSFTKWEDRFLCGTALVDGMPKPYGRAHARAPVAPVATPPPPHTHAHHTHDHTHGHTHGHTWPRPSSPSTLVPRHPRLGAGPQRGTGQA